MNSKSDIIDELNTLKTSNVQKTKTLDDIIEEVVDRKIKEYYDTKLVSENVQVRVGNTIFSGNLKPLPKKK